MVDLLNIKEGDIIKFRCGGEVTISQPAFNRGDTVDIKFEGEDVGIMYELNGLYYKRETHPFDIVEIITKPFDWDDVKAGQAFKHIDGELWWFVSICPKDSDNIIFVQDIGHYDYFCISDNTMTPAPEKDIKEQS